VPVHGLYKVHYAFSSYHSEKFTIDYGRYLTNVDVSIMLDSYVEIVKFFFILNWYFTDKNLSHL
jgi:hypothetical protein